MKIISKFKDYYDGGMSLGIDETIHYVRTKSNSDISKEMLEILSPKNWTTLSSNYHNGRVYNGRDIESYHTRFLFFCGRAYPVVYYTYESKKRFNTSTKTNILLGYDECFKFFKQLDNSKSAWRYSNELELFKKIMSDLTSTVILDEHVKYQSPILFYSLINQGEVTLNVKLKDLEFYRVVDTFTAFQEIGMFLGSTLCDVSTPKMPVGDDKVILNSKGFDPKYGFRTRPHKK